MGKEATKFVKEQRNQKKCMTDEEAIEAIKRRFGDKGDSYAAAWERIQIGSQMGKEATKFVKEQRKQEKCMSDEEAIEAIKSNFGDKGDSYAAAWEGIQIGSQMVKVVTELVNEQVKKGECNTPEETIDWIKSHFGDKGESYARAWEGTHMSTIATKFVEQLKKERKYTTAKAAMEAIRLAFGDKGESYANAWARTQKIAIVVEFVEQLMEQGKCQSYTEAIDAIKEEFGDQGWSYIAAFERGAPAMMYMKLTQGQNQFLPNQYAQPQLCSFYSQAAHMSTVQSLPPGYPPHGQSIGMNSGFADLMMLQQNGWPGQLVPPYFPPIQPLSHWQQQCILEQMD